MVYGKEKKENISVKEKEELQDYLVKKLRALDNKEKI